MRDSRANFKLRLGRLYCFLILDGIDSILRSCASPFITRLSCIRNTETNRSQMFFSPTKTLLRNTSKAIPSRFRTGYAYPFGSGFAHRTSKMPVLASGSCIQGRDSCTPSNFSHYSPLISTPRLLRKPNFAASQVHQYTSTESPLPSTPPETESDSKVVSDQEYNIRLGESKFLIQRWVM